MNEHPSAQFSISSLNPAEEIRGRRNFMQPAALLSGLALAMGTAPLFAREKQKKPSGKNDIGILNTALALEHEGIAAYQIAAESGLLQPPVLAVGVLFQSHHKTHRDELAKLVKMAGGTPVEPKSLADYAKDINAAAIKSQEDILRLAVRLERGATSAYIGSITSLHDFKLAQRFASLGADEAIHWNTLSSAIGEPPPKDAFIFG